MKEVVDQFLSFDRVELEGTYLEPNDGARAAILLVHGIDADRDDWGFASHCATALAGAGIASFRFDWRCFGVDASRPLTELTLAGLQNDIDAAFLRLCHLSEIPAQQRYLGATSFGGGVALKWASSRPGELRGVFLFAPVLEYTGDYLTSQDLATVSGLTERTADKLNRDGFIETWNRPFSKQLVNEFPRVDAAPAPEVPIDIFHGDIDTGVDIASSRRFEKQVGNSRLVVLPGVEHGFAEPGDDELSSSGTIRNQRTVFDEVIRRITEFSSNDA